MGKTFGNCLNLRLKSRRTENVVYLFLWLIAIGIYTLNIIKGRAEVNGPLFDVNMLPRMVKTLIPFMILFGINNWLLIPRLLLRNRVKSYFLAAGALVTAMWIYQFFEFSHFFNSIPEDMKPKPASRNHPHPLLPMPLLLDFTYALLLMGGNMAIALLFQRFEDKLERESLMKANAENELAYLKAQINPHFYMNMLNNIHGMIEIDPEKAQSMVIDMSKLMRYMLYDSSQTRIPLENEIDFLRNYLRIMRRRFPEDKVKIIRNFPNPEETAQINIPPLLFLVFVENAFKHGISYRELSIVNVDITIKEGQLFFSCVNSRHKSEENKGSDGIGLRNVSQRLNLLYGPEATLKISENDNEYAVTLTIPLNETKDSYN